MTLGIPFMEDNDIDLQLDKDIIVIGGEKFVSYSQPSRTKCKISQATNYSPIKSSLYMDSQSHSPNTSDMVPDANPPQERKQPQSLVHDQGQEDGHGQGQEDFL